MHYIWHYCSSEDMNKIEWSWQARVQNILVIPVGCLSLIYNHANAIWSSYHAYMKLNVVHGFSWSEASLTLKDGALYTAHWHSLMYIIWGVNYGIWTGCTVWLMVTNWVHRWCIGTKWASLLVFQNRFLVDSSDKLIDMQDYHFLIDVIKSSNSRCGYIVYTCRSVINVKSDGHQLLKQWTIVCMPCMYMYVNVFEEQGTE